MTTQEIRHRPRGSAGFTLIETLVVLALIAILAGISGAQLYRYIDRIKLMNTAQETSMLLRLARLEAVKNSSTGVVKIQRDPVFNKFWVVLSFLDRDGNGDLDGSDKQLGYFELPRTVRVAGVDDFSTKTPYNIAIYKSDGTIDKKGSFRFVNSRDDELEVRVPLDSGVKIVLRKKVGPGDYREQGQYGVSWTWN